MHLSCHWQSLGDGNIVQSDDKGQALAQEQGRPSHHIVRGTVERETSKPFSSRDANGKSSSFPSDLSRAMGSMALQFHIGLWRARTSLPSHYLHCSSKKSLLMRLLAHKKKVISRWLSRYLSWMIDLFSNQKDAMDLSKVVRWTSPSDLCLGVGHLVGRRRGFGFLVFAPEVSVFSSVTHFGFFLQL